MDNTSEQKTGKIDVGYVANLARMYLTDQEKEKFQKQLEQIVGFVQKIGELDLEGIEPTSHAHLVTNVFRKDEPGPSLSRDKVLANAPAQADGQFTVPKILE